MAAISPASDRAHHTFRKDRKQLKSLANLNFLEPRRTMRIRFSFQHSKSTKIRIGEPTYREPFEMS